MLRVEQFFNGPRVGDVAAAVRAELDRIGLGQRIRRGASVAIAAGSRGITDGALVVRTVAEAVRAVGAEPFIVPAMGSHGGATAEGQRAVLEGYGITEAYTGAPIRSSMDVVEIGRTEDGVPLHFDRHAHEADHVVLVNRVKPHTTFSGPIESGLMKMLMIGLGKHAGAAIFHRASVQHSFDRLVTTAGRALLARCRIACGLAIVENAWDETARIEALPPEAMEAGERALLVLAKRWMPRLPVERADLLIVDEMGKNISGLGMDTNITGRKPGLGCQVQVSRLFVRDLTPKTHGNAHGIGLAEFTTTRLVRAMDYRATVINSLAAVHPEAALIPVHFDTDREAIDAALGTIGLEAPERTRIVRIRNTLRLGDVLVSEPCRPELAGRSDVRIIEPPQDLAFDATGNLLPFDGGR
jgi:hypothetical protein